MHRTEPPPSVSIVAVGASDEPVDVLHQTLDRNGAECRARLRR